MRDFIKIVLGIIAILVVTIGIAYLGNIWRKGQNEAIYNNGVCADCGGHYVFVSAAKNRYKTYYYYQCDNCEKIIELRH